MQHDLTIANQGFPAFRADLNDALQALGSCQSGTSAPSPTFANQLWYDTTNNILKIRNEDNDAWISIATLDQSGDLVALLVANTVNSVGDSTISGLTVGKGGGAVATNTAVGANVLSNGSQSGAYNTAVGYNSSYSNTTGYLNTSLGRESLYTNSTGFHNTALGQSALYANTTGNYNIAVGGYANSSNTTGASNTSLGYQSLNANTTASNNTAVGYQAGYTSSTGGYNTIMGYQALYTSTVSNNTAIGYQAGYATTTGSSNMFAGMFAGNANTTGSYNTFLGARGSNGNGSGGLVTTGSKNTIVGAYDGNTGGLDIRTASNYIVLSDGDGNPRFIGDSSGNWGIGAASGGAAIYIEKAQDSMLNLNSTSGYNPLIEFKRSGTRYGYIQPTINDFRIAAENTTNGLVITAGGSGGVKLTNTATSWVSNSDITLKNVTGTYETPLDDIAQIEAIKFTWKSDKTNRPQVGVSAQSVQKVIPEAVEADNEGILGVRYTEIIPLLIASIQELKAEVDSLKQQLGK